ncbi:hypothetical protein A2875_01765 [Candidatus Gottesmanbacteria bacterium RIFCSPHIGHO2_01_FULL_46_14]|uniref:Transport permease protein n=2 Tax=Candidatus Gottesmaniibacteriota TaxID=1752720 RepID=A0A1F5ZJD4_9BACT|nr:MAG: hypothetical protein A2875_01765 [Candidatus Gottesmanbacteria bacterium RIFCSPHIGHO2_01_FULL_46_14]OGG29760.1 MAG: hypothetical protein A2971_00685 [Candidatus Gottesmanbacteria bacterium RIFCSPLOWO2_01_FULL_46_21]
MNRSRIAAIVLKNWFSFRRDFFRIFDIFWWPTFMLFVWGLLSIYLTKTSVNSPNFVTILLGGVILWNTFDHATRDVSRTFVEEVWDKNLANFFSTPLTLTEYLVGILAIAIVKIIVGALFMLMLARLFYAFDPMALSWFLIVGFVSLVLTGWLISIVIQAIILRYGHTVEVFIWAVAILLQPFSCVFYPLETLPGWAQRIALVLPTTYIFENMRLMIFSGSVRVDQIVLSYALNLFYGVCAVVFFYRTFRVAKDKGLLVKYV